MRRWFRSTNGGRTWEPIEINPRSPLARTTIRGDFYDDGQGNLYRYEEDE